MKLEFLPLSKLHCSRSNMRFAKKAPDVSDILPSIRGRGVLVPILVRPEPDAAGDSGFGVVAGNWRFVAATPVAEEIRDGGGDPEPMPSAILEAGDDVAALEASMLENLQRLDADEVTRWVRFCDLVRQGRTVADIATTFALPELSLKRTLALGNLLPRIRTLYRTDRIDATSVRHLTLASKSQQRDWLALLDDPRAHAPTGHQLKGRLFGGQAIPLRHALFDNAVEQLVTIADLFGEAAISPTAAPSGRRRMPRSTVAAPPMSRPDGATPSSCRTPRISPHGNMRRRPSATAGASISMCGRAARWCSLRATSPRKRPAARRGRAVPNPTPGRRVPRSARRSAAMSISIVMPPCGRIWRRAHRSPCVSPSPI